MGTEPDDFFGRIGVSSDRLAVRAEPCKQANGLEELKPVAVGEDFLA